MEKKEGKNVNEVPKSSEIIEAYHKFGEMISERIQEILDLSSDIIFFKDGDKKNDNDTPKTNKTETSNEQ